MEQDAVKSCTRNPKKSDDVKRYDEFSCLLHKHKYDKKVYCCILEQSESDKENKIIHISLTNDFFLKQDKDYFFSDKYEYAEGYHPYFYEFIVQLNDKKILSLLENIQNKWITATLIIDKNHKSCMHDKIVYLNGCLIFAASPIERIGACLVFDFQELGFWAEEVDQFKGDLHNRFNEWRLDQNDCDIKREFECFLNNIASVRCNAYNVGQGNNISLDINNKRMFFDVGEDIKGIKCISNSICEVHDDYKKCNEWEEDIKKEIKEIVPDFIVLSHWDLDHILGVANFDWKDYGDKGKYYSVYTASHWIAPDLRLVNNKSNSALRLCCYLLKNRMLWLVNALGQLVIDTGDCKLWQGRGGRPRNNNDIGLVLELSMYVSENRRQNMLLMGDCAFEEIDALKNVDGKDKYKCDILVTAHHGSRHAMPYGVIGNLHARAIISVGIGNSYNHPHIDHLVMLKRNGFGIYFTCETRKIVVSLGRHHLACLRTVD